MKSSLVLTTYNGGQFIIDQLESIYNQTSHLDEVLIFDDGSTDNTAELVERFIKDNNLSDWQFIVNAMEENDNIQLLVCDYQTFYDDDLPAVDREKVVVPVKKGIYSNIFNVLYPGCTYCARRELIHEAGSYWTEDTAHDELLWRIALFSDALYVYPKKLIYWRRHKDSSWALEGSRNKTLEARINWTEFAQNQINVIHDFMYNKNISSAEKEKLLDSNFRWLELRKKLFMEKSVISALKLILMKKYYNSFKQYLGDIYLTFFNR